ncbi:MAG: hypothetical protein WC877_00550 [Dehalococcoidales bacterium]|jgi:hypothetical protein
MSLKSHHQSILVARNIIRVTFKDQLGDYYRITDTYLNQIVIIKPNGSEEINHNCMYEKEYTIESMEKLYAQDKLTYKNYDVTQSVGNQQRSYSFDVTETKPISLVNLVKAKPINLNETLFDVLGNMYPQSQVMVEHIKNKESNAIYEKIKELACNEAETAIRNMKRNETYKQLGKY